MEAKWWKAENKFSGEKPMTKASIQALMEMYYLSPFQLAFRRLGGKRTLAQKIMLLSCMTSKEALELPLVIFFCPHRRLH